MVRLPALLHRVRLSAIALAAVVLGGCACQDMADEVGYTPPAPKPSAETPQRNEPDGGMPISTGGEGPVAPSPEVSATTDVTVGIGVHHVMSEGPRTTIWFTLFGIERDLGAVSAPAQIQVKAGDADLLISEVEVEPLASTPTRLALMFVVANHAGFDPEAQGVWKAIGQMASTLGEGDRVGLVHYGTTPGKDHRVDIGSPRIFAQALGKIRRSNETEPDPFMAIEVAVREFHAPDGAEEFLRFVVVIGDGHSRWDDLPSRKKWQERALGSLSRGRAIPIFVGVGEPGTPGHENFRSIAARARGIFLPAANEAGLRDVLDRVAGDIQSSERLQFSSAVLEGATEVTLRITAPEQILTSVSQEVERK
jgi:hypothetical protein